jgi:hypothetical protein
MALSCHDESATGTIARANQSGEHVMTLSYGGMFVASDRQDISGAPCTRLRVRTTPGNHRSGQSAADENLEDKVPEMQTRD